MSDGIRNIQKYVKDYLSEDFGFENIMVKYRRKKVLEVLSHYSPKKILEIGSGTNSKSFHLLWAYKAGLTDSIGKLTDTAKKLQQNTPFDMSILTKMVTDTDMEIIDKGSYFIKPFNHAKMQFLYENKIIDDILLEGLYNMTEDLPDLGAEIFVNCRKI